MKIKTGVIGLGRIGSQWDEGILHASPRTHVGAILLNRNYHLCSVCDIDEANRNRFYNDWKLEIPKYKSVEEMLKKEHLDVITVAVPSKYHYSVLKNIITKCPKLVFCEKPFCTSVSEAREIYALAKEQGVVLIVNYHRRWDEKINKLKKKIDAIPYIPSYVSVLYRKGLLNYGSHLVNLLMYLFGPILSVVSDTEPAHSWNVEDPSLSSLLNFESGLKAYIKGLDDVNYELFEIDIYYPSTRFHIESGGYIIEEHKAVNDVYFKDYVNLINMEDEFPIGEICGLEAAYKEIEEYIFTATPCETNDVFSALQTLKVLDSIRQSALKGHIITI